MTMAALFARHLISKMTPKDSVSTDPKDFVIGMESNSHYWLARYSNLTKSSYTVHVFNPIQFNALRDMYIRS